MSNSEETDKKILEQAVKPEASATTATSSTTPQETASAASATASTMAVTDKPCLALTSAATAGESKQDMADGAPSPKRARLSEEAQVKTIPKKEEEKKAEVVNQVQANTVETVAAKKEDDDKENDSHHQPTSEEEEVLDVCVKLGLKGGERLEVEWQLEEPASEANGGKPQTVNKWWGCRLMPHDGKTEDGVAVRQLEYDPYPEGGFPDPAVEDAIFLSHDILISPESHAEFRFRPEGVVQFNNEEETREAINGILMSTLNKHSEAWKNLDRAAQARIADGIAQKKEQLVEAIMNHSKSAVIGGEDMKEILQGIMQNKSK